MRKIQPLKNKSPKKWGKHTTRKWRRWDRTRTVALKERRMQAAAKEESLCEHCAMQGKPYRAMPVEGHHRIPRRIRPDLEYDLANVQFLCKRHHTLRTVLESVPPKGSRLVVTGPEWVAQSEY